MDYREIGRRIRKYRKAHGLSQEQLAERINISVTHMSHIETGNTKLSLPVLVDIACALEVQTDDLLFGRPAGRAASLAALNEILDRCTTRQIRIITDVARATQTALEKHGDAPDSRD